MTVLPDAVTGSDEKRLYHRFGFRALGGAIEFAKSMSGPWWLIELQINDSSSGY